MPNSFMYYEQVVHAIHQGEFNAMMLKWQDGTDRAIIFYMYNKQVNIEEVAKYLGFEEDFIKKRIKNIVSYYDKLYDLPNHESFSKTGR